MMTAAVNLAPVWCITVMFFSFSTHGVANGISTYPWGETLRQRSDKILKVLRDDVSFSIDKDWLPEPLKAGPASGLTFRNFDSDEYLCTLEEAKTRNGRDDVIPLHFYDPQLLSSKLNRRCSEITVDYWTYEWCHERGVSQYHLKHTKGSSADRDPLWSLGDFVSSDVVRERGEKNNMSAAIVQIVELFEGGQWCDETQSSRQSKVGSPVYHAIFPGIKLRFKLFSTGKYSMLRWATGFPAEGGQEEGGQTKHHQISERRSISGSYQRTVCLQLRADCVLSYYVPL